WRGANRWVAIASLLSALTTNFALYAWTGQRLDHWDANVFLAALLVGVVALIGVSLLTPPEPAVRLASLFGRLQTSSDRSPNPSSPRGRSATDAGSAAHDPSAPRAGADRGAAEDFNANADAGLGRPLPLLDLLGLP